MVLNSRFPTLSIRELYKSFDTIRLEWKEKSPLQMWSYIYSFGKALFQVVCYPLFEDDQRLNWFSYFIWNYIGVYGILIIYTAYEYIPRGEFSMWLPCTCMMAGPGAACAPTVLQFLSKNRKKFHSLVDFAGRYIYRNDREDTEYNRICTEQMNITMRSLKSKLILLCVGGLATEIGPIYYYIERGVKTSTTKVRIPFTDEDSNAEFLSNLTLQFIIFVHGFFVYYGSEIPMTIFENVAKVAPLLVQYELEQLIQQYERNEISDLKFRATFRNIEIQCLDFLSYIDEVKDFLYWKTLLMPPSFTYAVGMCIFCQYTMDFAPGYGMAFLIYVQAFYTCEVGEYIEDNRFADLLFETDWYKLPLSQQRDVMLLIHELQNGAKITMGPFSIINRGLFTVISKKVYSFVMFLLNFSA